MSAPASSSQAPELVPPAAQGLPAAIERAVREALAPLEDRPLVLAITGPPGSGKSSICRALCALLQQRGRVQAVCSSARDAHGLLAEVADLLPEPALSSSTTAPRSDAERITAIARRVRAADRRVVLLLDAPAGSTLAAALMKRSRERLSVVLCAGAEADELAADLTIDTTVCAAEWLRGDQPTALDPPLTRQLVALVHTLPSDPTPPSLQQLGELLLAHPGAGLACLYPTLEPWLDEQVVQLVRRAEVSPAALRALQGAALLERSHHPVQLERVVADELLAAGVMLRRAASLHVLATPAMQAWLRTRNSIDISDDEVTDFVLEVLGHTFERSLRSGALQPHEVGALRVFFGDGFRAHDAPVWDPPGAEALVVDLRHVPPARRAAESWLSRSAEPYLRKRLFWIAGGPYDEVLALGRELGRSRHQIRRMTPVLVRPEPALAASLAAEQAAHDALMLEFGERLLRSFVAGVFYAAGALLDTPASSGAEPRAFDALLAAVIQQKVARSSALARP